LGFFSISSRKVIYRKLLKNAPSSTEVSAGRQMQVELCEIPFVSSARSVFHLPVGRAILRVASRRIRSDVLPRRRVGEAARRQIGVFQQFANQSF